MGAVDPWLDIAGAGFEPLVADFDGDGFDDIAVEPADGEGVAIHFGPLPAGKVAWDDAETLITTGALLNGQAPIDVDGDGLPELPFQDGFVAVLRGVVAEEAATRVVGYTTSWSGVHPYFSGDFDGDGWTDILVGGAVTDVSGTESLTLDVDYGPLLQTGIDAAAEIPGPNQGRVLVATHAAETRIAGDLNGDLVPELTFHTPEPMESGEDPAYDAIVEVGDLRGLTVELSDITLASGNPAWMPIGDWDGDGVPDLYDWGGVWSGADLASGLFAEPLVATDPWTVDIEYALPDFDGDGADDLATSTGVGHWAVGSAAVGATLDDPSAVGTAAEMLAVYHTSGDLDGDLTPDVVCASSDGIGVWTVSGFRR